MSSSNLSPASSSFLPPVAPPLPESFKQEQQIKKDDPPPPVILPLIELSPTLSDDMLSLAVMHHPTVEDSPVLHSLFMFGFKMIELAQICETQSRSVQLWELFNHQPVEYNLDVLHANFVENTRQPFSSDIPHIPVLVQSYKKRKNLLMPFYSKLGQALSTLGWACARWSVGGFKRKECNEPLKRIMQWMSRPTNPVNWTSFWKTRASKLSSLSCLATVPCGIDSVEPNSVGLDLFETGFMSYAHKTPVYKETCDQWLTGEQMIRVGLHMMTVDTTFSVTNIHHQNRQPSEARFKALYGAYVLDPNHLTKIIAASETSIYPILIHRDEFAKDRFTLILAEGKCLAEVGYCLQVLAHMGIRYTHLDDIIDPFDSWFELHQCLQHIIVRMYSFVTMLEPHVTTGSVESRLKLLTYKTLMLQKHQMKFELTTHCNPELNVFSTEQLHVNMQPIIPAAAMGDTVSVHLHHHADATLSTTSDMPQSLLDLQSQRDRDSSAAAAGAGLKRRQSRAGRLQQQLLLLQTDDQSEGSASGGTGSSGGGLRSRLRRNDSSSLGGYYDDIDEMIHETSRDIIEPLLNTFKEKLCESVKRSLENAIPDAFETVLLNQD